MSEELNNKIIGGALWEDLHRRNYKLTAVERAQTIRQYMDRTNKNAVEVATEMNVSKKEIYRTLGLLKCSKIVIDMIENGFISGDKVSRVIYNLKDKSDDNIEKAVNDAINKKLNSVQIERMVSELNNNDKIAEHFRKVLRLAHLQINKIETEIEKLNKKSLTMVSIDTRHLSDALMSLNDLVERRKITLERENKGVQTKEQKIKLKKIEEELDRNQVER